MTDTKQPEHIRLDRTGANRNSAVQSVRTTLNALRNPQDYEEFLGGEVTTAFAVRTLREAMHLRVNLDPAYTLLEQ